MLKCPVCNKPLIDECVEKFDFGVTASDYATIEEISSCRCPACQLVYNVARKYTLVEEKFFE